MKINECKPGVLLLSNSDEEARLHGIYLGKIELFPGEYLYEMFCIEYKRTYIYSKHEIEYLWRIVQ